MKFTINANLIKKVIKKMSLITPSASFKPELTSIFIEVFELRINLQIKNDYYEANSEISDVNLIDVKKTGSFLLKTKILNDIVQHMNGEKIEFTKVENNLLIIKSADSEYEINLLDESRFEKSNFITNYSNDQKIVISGEKFTTLINSVIPSGDENNSRRLLQGINFIFENNKAISMATDGVRISTKEVDINFPHEKIEKNIPIKTIKEIIRIANGDVEISFEGNKFIITEDHVTIQGKIIEGTYPNVVEIFPKKFANKLVIEKEELLNLMERTIILSGGKVKDNIFIKFIFNNVELKLESRELEIGYANISTKKFDWDGEEDYQISLNPLFIYDALKAINDQEIEVGFNKNQEPLVIKGKKDNSYKTLLLPFRV